MIVTEPVDFTEQIGQVGVVELFEERAVAVLTIEFDCHFSVVALAALANARLWQIKRRQLARDRSERFELNHVETATAAQSQRNRHTFGGDFQKMIASARTTGAVRVTQTKLVALVGVVTFTQILNVSVVQTSHIELARIAQPSVGRQIESSRSIDTFSALKSARLLCTCELRR